MELDITRCFNGLKVTANGSGVPWQFFWFWSLATYTKTYLNRFDNFNLGQSDSCCSQSDENHRHVHLKSPGVHTQCSDQKRQWEIRVTGNTFRSSLNFGFFITGPSSLFADSTSPSELFRGILSWKWSILLSSLYCVRRCRNGRMPEYRGSLTPRAHYVKLNSSSKMRQPCTLVMRLQWD